MKAKSQKQRTLLVLKSLYKNSDKKHHTNLTKINKSLQEYGLEYRDKTLKDTISAMRNVGIEVSQSSNNSTASVWMENRPLDNGRLEKLVFSIASNPLLSQEQITEILQYLKPLVTEYQEEQLTAMINVHSNTIYINDNYIDTYTIISRAIRLHRRISFKSPHHTYEHTNSIKIREINYRVSFTPKYILHPDNNLYVVGYNNQTKYIEAFDIKDIVHPIMFSVRNLCEGEMIDKLLDSIDPLEYVKKLNKKR